VSAPTPKCASMPVPMRRQSIAPAPPATSPSSTSLSLSFCPVSITKAICACFQFAGPSERFLGLSALAFHQRSELHLHQWHLEPNGGCARTNMMLLAIMLMCQSHSNDATLAQVWLSRQAPLCSRMLRCSSTAPQRIPVRCITPILQPTTEPSVCLLGGGQLTLSLFWR
jgi:hypothetical protein